MGFCEYETLEGMCTVPTLLADLTGAHMVEVPCIRPADKQNCFVPLMLAKEKARRSAHEVVLDRPTRVEWPRPRPEITLEAAWKGFKGLFWIGWFLFLAMLAIALAARGCR